jgi:integrase
MVTVKATLLKHNQKADGTYNVKIRITHNRVSRYLDTNHFVASKQLNKKLEIKDSVINLQVDKTLNGYRQQIGELGTRIDLMSCDDVVNYLKSSTKEIDFIEFGKAHINGLIEKNQNGSATNYKTVINSLVDFFKRERILVSEINANMLRSYEKYLRSERKIVRESKKKRAFTIINPGLSDSGLHNHMRDLRGLFIAARNQYNDEDLGIIRIPHYPFKKYKIINKPETPKRNIQIDQVLKIRDCKCEAGSRIELAKDLFMLSFYLCGTNAVDFYQMDDVNIKKGRLEYKRSKTRGKRKDQAFISIKIIPESKALIKKYIGSLQNRFSTRAGLSTALSQGLRRIQKSENIPDVTFYWARHTFATLARNTCRKSKDDVAMALNHIDEGRKTTDIYIEKDWAIVDEVQSAVISLLN